MCLLIWEYGIHRIGPSHTLSGRHLFTHVSIPFIHDPRYLNLLPPHPGKLLSAPSRVANVFFFYFLLPSSLNVLVRPNFFFFPVVVVAVVIVSCENKTETKHEGCAVTGRQLSSRTGPQQRRGRTGLCWFVFAFVEDSRKRE